jgi:hypothetical protein
MASKESDARPAANGKPCLTSTATLRMDDHKAHGTAAARIVTRQAASGLDTEPPISVWGLRGMPGAFGYGRFTSNLRIAKIRITIMATMATLLTHIIAMLFF